MLKPRPAADSADGEAPSAACCPVPSDQAHPDRGSRRRRLWELGSHAHCPVVGVCLRLETMRRLAAKLLRLGGEEDDYTLHCALVTAAARRNPLSEALQREFDQTFALDLRQAAQVKDTDGLLAWWRARAAQGELAGAMWATLSHPRCNQALEMRVLGQVHMLQHQLGAAQRVDLQRHRELIAEHRALCNSYAQAQHRVTHWREQRTREQAGWDRERLQLRATALALQTQLAQAQEQLQYWQAAHPELPERLSLQRRLQDQTERCQALQRELNRLQSQPAAVAAVQAEPLQAPPQPAATPALAQRVVLCVGGRAHAVPLYRRTVEASGAQFLHHDGGAEHRPAQLEPHLAAADLVVCQVGCISHDAYWRVKDHCKRHNKRCVFVDTPSRSAFERALALAADSA